jgi:hypothetical protein
MDYPMSRTQYRQALADFGITQGYAAWIFGGKSRFSGRRWAAEGAPYAVALVISMMRDLKLKPEDIEKYGEPWRNKKRRRK